MALDVALFVENEGLRSLASSEIVASIGVVLRGTRWLQIRRNLKTRRSVDFDFPETAGRLQVRGLTAGFDVRRTTYGRCLTPQRPVLASDDVFRKESIPLDVLPRQAFGMTVQLSKELAAALHACGELQLEVVDPVTSRVYFIVESETHRQAMAALRARQDREAIAQGLAEMEAGQGVPVEEAFDSIRTRLGLRRRQL